MPSAATGDGVAHARAAAGAGLPHPTEYSPAKLSLGSKRIYLGYGAAPTLTNVREVIQT